MQLLYVSLTSLSSLPNRLAYCNNVACDAVSHFKDYNYGSLKKEVADIVVEKITAIQEKYNEIINSNIIDEILDEGKKKTNEIAKAKYEEVISKIGLGR